MGRVPKTSRTKRTASSKSTRKRKKAAQTIESRFEEGCSYCGANSTEDLSEALFVEEESGRIFCSEGCIVAYFSPDIERLEREYYENIGSNEISESERSRLAYLRWKTLESPHEIWREKTLAGDNRYILIREFTYMDSPIWSVCVSLFLRGEPSFLFIAFVSIDPRLVEKFRKGERVQWLNPRSANAHERSTIDPVGFDKEEEIDSNQYQANDVMFSSGEEGASRSEQEASSQMDRLADPFTEEEIYRAQVSNMRGEDDIQPDDFVDYENCLEETLQVPDEVWMFESGNEGQKGRNPKTSKFSSTIEDSDKQKLYHFLRHYADKDPSVWYVIVAKETDDEEQLEIVDAFPTRDPLLVDHFRRGVQEIGAGEEKEKSSGSRVLH